MTTVSIWQFKVLAEKKRFTLYHVWLCMRKNLDLIQHNVDLNLKELHKLINYIWYIISKSYILKIIICMIWAIAPYSCWEYFGISIFHLVFYQLIYFGHFWRWKCHIINLKITTVTGWVKKCTCKKSTNSHKLESFVAIITFQIVSHKDITEGTWLYYYLLLKWNQIWSRSGVQILHEVEIKVSKHN